MKVSKWYQVLVMGGVSLVQSGCVGTEAQALDMGGSLEPDVETEQSADATQDAANIADDTGAADALISRDADNEVDAGQTDAAAARDMSVPDAAPADAADLACSDPSSPSDPCGCPCCWAVGFLNSDPECNGFCSAGNSGAGCCPE